MAWTRQTRRREPVDLRTDQAHTARMYDYLLGGKDNFPADREAAEQAIAGAPYLRTTARENRAFMHRAVRHLAEQQGIRQFLDIGTGIPTSPNLHEVAQAAAPDARVVYTDNDPIVLTHARALLGGSAAGRTAYLEADLGDVDTILDSAELRDTLDLSRPVAVSVIAILHFLPDPDAAYDIVRRLVAPLPAGSCLTISHATADFDPTMEEQAARSYRARGIPVRLRSRDEIAPFFAGFDLVAPGIQSVHRWRPDDNASAAIPDGQVNVYGAVGSKR
ncbi:SAM-dependent methyltransferase [Frankia canadensis]|nr:SAM-dependent methyltransferase [Frankia canadensis]